jgi:hypothetical protein
LKANVKQQNPVWGENLGNPGQKKMDFTVHFKFRSKILLKINILQRFGLKLFPDFLEPEPFHNYLRRPFLTGGIAPGH